MASSTYDSIESIQTDLPTKYHEYRLSAEPTSGEVRKLARATQNNLKSFNCLLAGTAVNGLNWGFILEIEAGWRSRHLIAQGVDMTNPIAVQNAVTPPYPHCANPGEFQPDENWSLTRLQIATMNHEKHVANYNFKTRLIRAIFNEYKLAIPSGVLSNFLDVDDNFIQTVTIQSILAYLKHHYNQLSSEEITKIHLRFNQPFDTAGTHGDHFKRPQICQAEMATSLEPIVDATMMRVCLGHFEVLPSMAAYATKWTTKANNVLFPAETWPSFKGWWSTAFLDHNKEQRSLNLGGIANSAISGDDVETKIIEVNTKMAQVFDSEMEVQNKKLALLEEKIMAMSATGTASLAGFPPPSIITTQTTADALLKAENANLKAQLAEKTSRTKRNARRNSDRPS